MKTLLVILLTTYTLFAFIPLNNATIELLSTEDIQDSSENEMIDSTSVTALSIKITPNDSIRIKTLTEVLPQVDTLNAKDTTTVYSVINQIHTIDSLTDFVMRMSLKKFDRVNVPDSVPLFRALTTLQTIDTSDTTLIMSTIDSIKLPALLTIYPKKVQPTDVKEILKLELKKQTKLKKNVTDTLSIYRMSCNSKNKCDDKRIVNLHDSIQVFTEVIDKLNSQLVIIQKSTKTFCIADSNEMRSMLRIGLLESTLKPQYSLSFNNSTAINLSATLWKGQLIGPIIFDIKTALPTDEPKESSDKQDNNKKATAVISDASPLSLGAIVPVMYHTGKYGGYGLIGLKGRILFKEMRLTNSQWKGFDTNIALFAEGAILKITENFSIGGRSSLGYATFYENLKAEVDTKEIILPSIVYGRLDFQVLLKEKFGFNFGVIRGIASDEKVKAFKKVAQYFIQFNLPVNIGEDDKE
ncbi:MAG: hypothetical protein OCD01_19090 [Fibrobacterales bacterium]